MGTQYSKRMTTINMTLFEEKNAYATLLAIYHLGKPDKSAIYKFITGKADHIKSIEKRIKDFEEFGLVETEEERGVPSHIWVWLTEKGKEIARKLSYVFDLEKEVIALPKEKYDILQKILEKITEGTVEEFVLRSVIDKINKHKAIK